jgi:hypothetical protein
MFLYSLNIRVSICNHTGDRIPVGARFSAPVQTGPPSFLYNGYRVFPGGKLRPGRAADHLPPSSAVVMEEYSYTSTHPLGQTGPVTGLLYLLHVAIKYCTSTDFIKLFQPKIYPYIYIYIYI